MIGGTNKEHATTNPHSQNLPLLSSTPTFPHNNSHWTGHLSQLLDFKHNGKPKPYFSLSFVSAYQRVSILLYSPPQACISSPLPSAIRYESQPSTPPQVQTSTKQDNSTNPQLPKIKFTSWWSCRGGNQRDGHHHPCQQVPSHLESSTLLESKITRSEQRFNNSYKKQAGSRYGAKWGMDCMSFAPVLCKTFTRFLYYVS